MSIHIHKKLIAFAICLLFIVICTSCEEFLSDSYQSKTFNISQLDSTACKYLTSDLTYSEPVIENGDTSYVTHVIHKSIMSSLITDLVDSTAKDTNAATIQMIFDSLFTEMDTLVTDTTLNITSPEEADTSFAFYYQNGSNKDMYFYLSWEFTEANMNAFIELDLIKKDATFVTQKLLVPIESISGCSEHVIFEESGREELIPKIRARIGYELTEGPYLVRFIFSESDVFTSFRTVILHN